MLATKGEQESVYSELLWCEPCTVKRFREMGPIATTHRRYCHPLVTTVNASDTTHHGRSPPLK